MIITGRKLQIVRNALELALGEVHNQIATCPDVFLYGAEIDELNATKVRLERFAMRVDKALAKEQSK